VKQKSNSGGGKPGARSSGKEEERGTPIRKGSDTGRSSREAERSSVNCQAKGNLDKKHQQFPAETSEAGTTVVKSNGWKTDLQKADAAEDKSEDV